MKLKLVTTTQTRLLQVTELRDANDWTLLRAGIHKLLRESRLPLVLDFGTLGVPPENFTEQFAALRWVARLEGSPLFALLLTPNIPPGSGVFLTAESLHNALKSGELLRVFYEESTAAQVQVLRTELDAAETQTAQTLELRKQVAQLKSTRRLLRLRLADFARRARATPDLELQPRLAPSLSLHQALESTCKKAGLL